MDIACLVFDGITALDIVGPYEVLWRLPDAQVRFVAPDDAFLSRVRQTIDPRGTFRG